MSEQVTDGMEAVCLKMVSGELRMAMRVTCVKCGERKFKVHILAANHHVQLVCDCGWSVKMQGVKSA